MTGALSTAKRSHPKSEVRGRSWEDHARRAAAKRSYPTSKVRGSGREELPHAPTPKARSGG